MTGRPFVVVGDTSVARRCVNALGARNLPVLHLGAPSDDELRDALVQHPRGVAILTHSDVTSLRYALAAAHTSARIPLVACIFDRTIGEQLSELLPRCHVTSPAELAAAPLAGPCLAPGLLAAVRGRDGQVEEVVSSDTGPRRQTSTRRRPPWWQIALTRLTGLLRSPDTGTRMLLLGLAGLLTVLLTDWAVLVVLEHRDVFEALHEAVGVIATVGPGAQLHGGHGYAVFSSVAMIATILLTAMFTAGVVDRILGPRLVGLLGPRVLPHSDHVVVVGLGQVGVRLCRELLALGVPVVGVERDRGAKHLRLVRALRIPVVLGDGSDRRLLEKLRVHRARALAAVGSDDLDNIAVALAVAGTAPACRLIIRAGEHEAIAETRSLLPLGIIRDVASISAAYVVAQLLGERPLSVVSARTDLFVETARGMFTPFDLDERRPSIVRDHGGSASDAKRNNAESVAGDGELTVTAWTDQRLARLTPSTADQSARTQTRPPPS